MLSFKLPYDRRFKFKIPMQIGDPEEYVNSFRPDLMEPVAAWVRGARFAELTKMTSIFEVRACHLKVRSWGGVGWEEEVRLWPCLAPFRFQTREWGQGGRCAWCE